MVELRYALRHALVLNGTVCGYLASVQGGWGFADVIEDSERDAVVGKHIGQPRWEELELQLILPLPRPVADWIAAFWTGKVQSSRIEIITADLEQNAIRRRTFHSALLTETTIAKLDGSYDASRLTLKLVFQDARLERASGTVAAPRPLAARQLFPRLQLPGLDCTKVMPIDAFTVRRPVVEHDPRFPLQQGPLSFPNLIVTLPESSARDWHQWFHNFVIRGDNDNTREKTGTLSVMDERSTELVRIGLFNVGIFRLQGPIEIADRLPYVVAGLYCQRMEFTVP